MTLDPKTFQLILQTFNQVLREDRDPQARAKSAQCLGRLGNMDILPILCSALQQEDNPDVKVQIMDAIVELVNSDPITPMSEQPKYDLRGATIGNFADTVQTGGHQEATQHIYASDQDFDRLLADYKQLIDELQQKYPTQVPEPAIIEAEFREIEQTQPQRWQNFLSLKRLWNGGKKATIKLGEHFTEESLWGKVAIAFLDGVTDKPD